MQNNYLNFNFATRYTFYIHRNTTGPVVFALYTGEFRTVCPKKKTN